jgi:hypothetical protein
LSLAAELRWMAGATDFRPDILSRFRPGQKLARKPRHYYGARRPDQRLLP